MPAGAGKPAASRMVGMKSMPEMKCSLSTTPALTLPGQRTSQGVRVLVR